MALCYPGYGLFGFWDKDSGSPRWLQIHCAGQHDLELPLSPPPRCRNYRSESLWLALFIYIYLFEAVCCKVVQAGLKLAKLAQFDFKLPLSPLASGITCVSHHKQMNILILKSWRCFIPSLHERNGLPMLHAFILQCLVDLCDYSRSSQSLRADSKPQHLGVNTTAGCPITNSWGMEGGRCIQGTALGQWTSEKQKQKNKTREIFLWFLPGLELTV